jgi:Ala-tRNA(Pro) deacylase
MNYKKGGEAMAEKRLLRYLEEHNVSYELIKHAPTYSTQETAASTHISAKIMAKPVLVNIDGHLAMIVEPGHTNLDLQWLKNQLNVKSLELASEEDFKDWFPGCEVGAMPPFGNLYDINVYFIDKIAHNGDIAFEAGTHSELIKMSFQDYLRLVQPEILH